MAHKNTPSTEDSARESDYAPLYAVAGLTDALAEVIKGALSDTQQKASKRINDLQSKAPDLSKQAHDSAEELRTFVITLPNQVRQLPEATRARIVELQKQANDLINQANTTYGDLAGRGKRVVDEARDGARHLSARAGKRAGDLKAEAADAVDPAFEKVQEGVTRARKNVTGRTATETMTPRSAAKASATKAAKTPGAKAPAKKSPAKKAPAKSSAAKASAARSAAAKSAAKTSEPAPTTSEAGDSTEQTS